MQVLPLLIACRGSDWSLKAFVLVPLHSIKIALESGPSFSKGGQRYPLDNSTGFASVYPSPLESD